LSHRIIVVDDEQVAMQSYQRELELQGYEVWFCRSADEAESFLTAETRNPADLFIVDVMLPSGTIYSDEKTGLGLYTGLFLAQKMRKTYPNVPIILFTNASFPLVRDAAKRLSSRLDNCILLRKEDYLPFELAEVVNAYFKELKLRPNRSRLILRRLFGSLILQPNISGLGIDLKKLGEHD
jgi:CheY-like chemotaxis protein